MTLHQIRLIDPDFDVSQAPKPKVKEKKDKSSELVFLDLDDGSSRDDEPARSEEQAPPGATDAAADQALELLRPFGEEERDEETTLVTPERLEVDRAPPGVQVESDEVDTLEGLDSQPTFTSEAAGGPVIDIEPTVAPMTAAIPMTTWIRSPSA